MFSRQGTTKQFKLSRQSDSVSEWAYQFCPSPEYYHEDQSQGHQDT